MGSYPSVETIPPSYKQPRPLEYIYAFSFHPATSSSRITSFEHRDISSIPRIRKVQNQSFPSPSPPSSINKQTINQTPNINPLLSKHKSSSSSSSSTKIEKMASPVKFTHYAQAQTSFKPPLIANENAFLGDVSSSEVRSK